MGTAKYTAYIKVCDTSPSGLTVSERDSSVMLMTTPESIKIIINQDLKHLFKYLTFIIVFCLFRNWLANGTGNSNGSYN